MLLDTSLAFWVPTKTIKAFSIASPSFGKSGIDNELELVPIFSHCILTVTEAMIAPNKGVRSISILLTNLFSVMFAPIPIQ